MNFFSAQQSARRSTLLLSFLFVFAIVLLLVLSNFFLFQYLYTSQYSDITFSIDKLSLVYDQHLMIVFSSSIFAFITLGSFYKLMTLRAGGSAIAESLGGTAISRNSNDKHQRKILNIVEEMAIASGMPVPQVYLLNEHGINAFAAGWKISNAVIGVTQGALEKLTRDELQGVIAHEFSHIFNGDMKINLRLIAVLHSILMIGHMGRFALRSLHFSTHSRSSRKGGGSHIVIIAIGLMMTIVGYTGMFFGNWIKSLISKQREYLADASAVQFTRNNAGIADALKKIGGAPYGSRILYASADEYSHGYFALSDLQASFFSFSTHPPLTERIKRIQPSWNGQFIMPSKKDIDAKKIKASSHKNTIDKVSLVTGIAMNAAINNLNSIGDISAEKIDLAQQWQRNIPDFIHLYANEPSDARLLIFALLMDTDKTVSKKQLSIIENYQNNSAKNVTWLAKQIQQLELANDINIIDIALPSLQLMSLPQFKAFAVIIKKLIKADKKIDLKEWAIQRMLLQHLKTHFALRNKPLAHYFILGSAKKHIEIVLSLLSYLEHGDTPEAINTFNIAKKSISAHAFNIIEHKQLSLKALDLAVDHLEQLKPPLKQKFLIAATHCIAHDGDIKKQSYELLRSIASCIDTPLPPINSTIH